MLLEHEYMDCPIKIGQQNFLESDIPLTPIPNNNIIKYYDQMFPTLEEYQNFINAKLRPWQNTLEFKYFNSMYQHQWSTSELIKRLRTQGQKLLEAVNHLQERKISTRHELKQHLHTMTWPKLQKHLCDPIKIYLQPPFPRVQEVLRLTPTSPSSSFHPCRTIYSNTPQIQQLIGFWCFQCNSPHHIKWDCREYQCWICKIVAPGHSQRDCPEKNKLQHEDDGQQGYHDTYGFEDGNLTGESEHVCKNINRIFPFSSCQNFLLYFL